jgi:hypothetical protein
MEKTRRIKKNNGEKKEYTGRKKEKRREKRLFSNRK